MATITETQRRLHEILELEIRGRELLEKERIFNAEKINRILVHLSLQVQNTRTAMQITGNAKSDESDLITNILKLRALIKKTQITDFEQELILRRQELKDLDSKDTQRRYDVENIISLSEKALKKLRQEIELLNELSLKIQKEESDKVKDLWNGFLRLCNEEAKIMRDLKKHY